MTIPFMLRLYIGDSFVSEEVCTSLSLEREAYTPFDEVTAVFLSEHHHYESVNRIAVMWKDVQIFLGIAERVVQFRKNGVSFVRIHSKSFTSLLTQNELKKGLYTNMTISKLVYDYYRMPFVTCEEHPDTGYININERKSLWDCIVSFGYRSKKLYPYIRGNQVCISLPDAPELHVPEEDKMLEYGTVYDTSKLVSHYHMEDFDGEPDVYSLENPVAVNANIVRHKQIAFDRLYLWNPNEALAFRNRFSLRGWKAKYLVYEGFANEELGERVSFGTFLQNKTICRVRVNFGQNGLRTWLYAYEDGFYQ